MIEAYTSLHEAGYAHSVECWQGGDLVGGLYGVAIGGIFFGESMFSNVTDSSKVALAALASFLHDHNFDLIDCQVTTEHLMRMGARQMSAGKFYDILRRSIIRPTLRGSWQKMQN